MIKLKNYLDIHAWLPICAVIILFIPHIGFSSYLLISAYALFGNRQIIETLFLSWLFSMLHSEIMPDIQYQSLLKYLLFLTGFFSILFRNNFLILDRFTALTLGLGIFLIFHGVFFSQILVISVLKAFSWTMIIYILILAWKGLSYQEIKLTKNWITTNLLFVLWLSLLLYLVYPKYGYLLNSRFFQGILNHPQALGLTSAIVLALLINKINFKNISIFFLINALLSLFLIFLSYSRTAGLAFLFAANISLLLFVVSKMSNVRNLFKLRIKKTKIINFVLIISIISIFIFQFSGIFKKFIFKSLKNESVYSFMEIYNKSREVLYNPMLENINNNFLTGIGFGLSSDPSSMNIAYIGNIPVSAPIEKGVLPLAILEEVGLYGFIFFSIWILILMIKIYRHGFQTFLVLLTVLLFNFGEAGLFSPNGFGMLYIIIICSLLFNPKLKKNSN